MALLSNLGAFFRDQAARGFIKRNQPDQRRRAVEYIYRRNARALADPSAQKSADNFGESERGQRQHRLRGSYDFGSYALVQIKRGDKFKARHARHCDDLNCHDRSKRSEHRQPDPAGAAERSANQNAVPDVDFLYDPVAQQQKRQLRHSR